MSTSPATGPGHKPDAQARKQLLACASGLCPAVSHRVYTMRRGRVRKRKMVSGPLSGGVLDLNRNDITSETLGVDHYAVGRLQAGEDFHLPCLQVPRFDLRPTDLAIVDDVNSSPAPCRPRANH